MVLTLSQTFRRYVALSCLIISTPINYLWHKPSYQQSVNFPLRFPFRDCTIYSTVCTPFECWLVLRASHQIQTVHECVSSSFAHVHPYQIPPHPQRTHAILHHMRIKHAFRFVQRYHCTDPPVGKSLMPYGIIQPPDT